MIYFFVLSYFHLVSNDEEKEDYFAVLQMHWRELWVTQGQKTPTHMRLCQMKDHVKERDREYTLSQSHRFICGTSEMSRSKRNHYTICEEAGCEGCAGIKKIIIAVSIEPTVVHT